MYRVALINMPFAAAHFPSIALTQLRAILSERLKGRIHADIHYLNHDFIEYFERDNYVRISDSAVATASGLGDWLFRNVAFPQLSDNAVEYLQRYARTLKIEPELLKSYVELRGGLNAFLDKLIDRYQLDAYDLVGLTSTYAQNTASFALARKLKQRHGNITTVMGGASCETSMGVVIARNVEAIDFVFSGPSLTTFPQLVENLINGQRNRCHGINGVFSRERLSRHLVGDVDEIGEELDVNAVVPLDYDTFLASLEQKCPQIRPVLLFETSRGCWWGERAHCTFCGLNGSTMRYRAMEADRAVRQFDALFRYVPRVSAFQAVDNILPREFLSTVLPRVNPPPDVSIFYEIKADLNDQEMMVLADARVTNIQPGIEALATSTLKLMKKGTTAFGNLKFLKSCLALRINPSWNLLVGFPGEGEEVYRKYVADLPLLVHLPPPSGAYPVRFDRFSPYFTMAAEYGLKLRPCDFYSLVYPFGDQELEDLAYFFTDENFDNAYIATTAKWIKKIERAVEHWQSRWHQRDGKARPLLAFEWRDEIRIVRDTRSGTSVEHELEPDGLLVLDCLAEPMKTMQLHDQMSETPAAELGRQLDDLRQRGLVFEENGRYLSLVVGMGREQGYL